MKVKTLAGAIMALTFAATSAVGVAAEGIKEAGGFILRTAAEGAGADEILMDIRYLRRLWDQIGAQIKTIGAPSVIYEDLGLALRTLRSQVIGLLTDLTLHRLIGLGGSVVLVNKSSAHDNLLQWSLGHVRRALVSMDV